MAVLSLQDCHASRKTARKGKGSIMDTATAIPVIRENWQRILENLSGKAKSKGYICPLCQNGTGEDGDGLLPIPPAATKKGKEGSLKCFRCGFSGDIFDLYTKSTGADFRTAITDLARMIGITVDEYKVSKQSPKNAQEAPEKAFPSNGKEGKQPGKKSAENSAQGQKSFLLYYRQCEANLMQPEAVAYLDKRGISLDTARMYMLGYDPKEKRLIVPVTDSFYVARSIIPGEKVRYKNPKGCSIDVFNWSVLYAQEEREIFVTEGVYDALSIIEAGAAAIAINGAGNTQALLKEIDASRTQATLILCFDKDMAGENATQTLKKELRQRNISCIEADIRCGHGDANDALVADREAFFDAVKAWKSAAGKPENTSFFITAFMKGEIERFKQDRKTGFSNLDMQAGGLYSGLYVLAGMPSVGKTTFALQLADQLAERGNDVVFVSLEMGRLELVTKSLSRFLAQQGIKGEYGNPITSLDIRRGFYSPQVMRAAEAYKAKIADRMTIIEGNFKCDTAFIEKYLLRYIKRNKVRPVCVIDYLQILSPSETKKVSAKEMVDDAVVSLKRMSRELDIPVLAVCSMNRNNYVNEISYEALKESGGIEYGCDCVWGLQFACVSDEDFQGKEVTEKRTIVKEAKAASPRKIELSCLKNRYGISSFSCFYNYYPATDLFEETEREEPKILNTSVFRRGRR